MCKLTDNKLDKTSVIQLLVQVMDFHMKKCQQATDYEIRYIFHQLT